MVFKWNIFKIGNLPIDSLLTPLWRVLTSKSSITFLTVFSFSD